MIAPVLSDMFEHLIGFYPLVGMVIGYPARACTKA